MKNQRGRRLRASASRIRLAVVLAAVAAALVVTPALRADLPIAFINVPNNATVEATSAAGAMFAYTDPAATDPLMDLAGPPTCGLPSGSTFPLGLNTVTCTVVDTVSGSVTTSFTVNVVDTTPPSIAVPSGVIVEALGPTGAPASFVASATDAVDGSLTPTCTPASGALFPVGQTTVTCTATDAHGNTGSQSFNVTVADTTPPVVTVTPPAPKEATGPNGAVVTFSASATDLVDGSLPTTCAPQSGSTFAVGATLVTCSATDAHGNTGSQSFTVNVVDTTPPTVNVPSPPPVEATGAAGATVAFAATALDLVDGPIIPSCAPASGATFPLGHTTVTCTATDAHGNTGSASFTVTVSDTTPPVITLPPALPPVEANSPSGSSPSYTPTAVDVVDGPVPVVCSPVSGTLLSIGTHTVTCSASDAQHNTSTATFTIDIVDTTPPVLTVPAPITVSTTGSSLPASTSAIATFLGSAAAHDIADPAPTVTNDAPATFPLGTTVVSFTAKDASGNTTTKSSAVVVVQLAPNTPPPPPPPVVDRTPPDDVNGVKVTGGGGQVTLTWSAPSAADFDHVVIVRSDANGGLPTTVYTGNASTYSDSSVRSGTEYRYVITAYDKAGNSSAGVALLVVPSRAVLVSPAAGVQVKKAPRLAWVAARGATYYNVQLFRAGHKILSLWPKVNNVQLPQAWRFGGHRYQLSHATYTWYVWPGLGPRSANRYGPVLGESTFVMG